MTCSSTEAYTVAGTQLFEFLPIRTLSHVRLPLDCKFNRYACTCREFGINSDVFLRLLDLLSSPCSEGRVCKKSERERFLVAASEPDHTKNKNDFLSK
jgi:hypothetical protein